MEKSGWILLFQKMVSKLDWIRVKCYNKYDLMHA